MARQFRRILGLLLALAMVFVPVGNTVSGTYGAVHAETTEQEPDPLAPLAWLYLNYDKLDEEARASAYQELTKDHQFLLEQLRTGEMSLFIDAEGRYFVRESKPAVQGEVQESNVYLPLKPSAEFAPGLTEPSVEVPVIEEPIIEEPIIEEPIIEEPIIEEPIIEEPIIEEPIIEEPIIEEPIIEEPIIEEPIIEEPIIEEPIIEEPIIEEPIIEEPIIEEPIIEEPVIEEPVIEEPIIEEPIIEEPVIEEPVIEEPIIEEPIIEEPIIEEPVVEESEIEEPIVEEPVIEEPIIEESEVEEPIVEEPVIEEPIIEESVTEEPIVEEPVAEEPSIEESVNEESVVGELVSEESVSGEAPSEEAATEENEEAVAEENTVEENNVQEPIAELVAIEEPLVEEMPVELAPEEEDLEIGQSVAASAPAMTFAATPIADEVMGGYVPDVTEMLALSLSRSAFELGDTLLSEIEAAAEVKLGETVLSEGYALVISDANGTIDSISAAGTYQIVATYIVDDQELTTEPVEITVTEPAVPETLTLSLAVTTFELGDALLSEIEAAAEVKLGETVLSEGYALVISDANGIVDSINQAGEYQVTASYGADADELTSEAVMIVVNEPTPVLVVLDVAETNFVYTGNDLSSDVREAVSVVKTDDTVVDAEVYDVKVAPQQVVDAGEYTVTITLKDSGYVFADDETSTETTVVVNPASISAATFEGLSFSYDGQDHYEDLPEELTFTSGNGDDAATFTLVNGIDFSYETGVSLVEAGEYILTVTGSGNFGGEATLQVAITVSLSDLTFDVVEKTYSGENQLPSELEGRYGDESFTLKQGKDFVYAQSNGVDPAVIDAGEYALALLPAEESTYSGENSVTVKVKPLQVALVNCEMTYTEYQAFITNSGKDFPDAFAQNQNGYVVTNEGKAQDEADYSWAVENPVTKPGDYNVEVSLKNANLTFGEPDAELIQQSSFTLKITDVVSVSFDAKKTLWYSGDDHKDTVVSWINVTDNAGNVLSRDTEYVVVFAFDGSEDYSKDTEIVQYGKYKVTIQLTEEADKYYSIPENDSVFEFIVYSDVQVDWNEQLVFSGNDQTGNVINSVKDTAGSDMDENEYILTFYDANDNAIDQVIATGAYKVEVTVAAPFGFLADDQSGENGQTLMVASKDFDFEIVEAVATTSLEGEFIYTGESSLYDNIAGAVAVFGVDNEKLDGSFYQVDIQQVDSDESMKDQVLNAGDYDVIVTLTTSNYHFLDDEENEVKQDILQVKVNPFPITFEVPDLWVYQGQSAEQVKQKFDGGNATGCCDNLPELKGNVISAREDIELPAEISDMEYSFVFGYSVTGNTVSDNVLVEDAVLQMDIAAEEVARINSDGNEEFNTNYSIEANSCSINVEDYTPESVDLVPEGRPGWTVRNNDTRWYVGESPTFAAEGFLLSAVENDELVVPQETNTRGIPVQEDATVSISSHPEAVKTEFKFSVRNNDSSSEAYNAIGIASTEIWYDSSVVGSVKLPKTVTTRDNVVEITSVNAQEELYAFVAYDESAPVEKDAGGSEEVILANNWSDNLEPINDSENKLLKLGIDSKDNYSLQFSENSENGVGEHTTTYDVLNADDTGTHKATLTNYLKVGTELKAYVFDNAGNQVELENSRSVVKHNPEPLMLVAQAAVNNSSGIPVLNSSNGSIKVTGEANEIVTVRYWTHPHEEVDKECLVQLDEEGHFVLKYKGQEFLEHFNGVNRVQTIQVQYEDSEHVNIWGKAAVIKFVFANEAVTPTISYENRAEQILVTSPEDGSVKAAVNGSEISEVVSVVAATEAVIPYASWNNENGPTLPKSSTDGLTVDFTDLGTNVSTVTGPVTRSFVSPVIYIDVFKPEYNNNGLINGRSEEKRLVLEGTAQEYEPLIMTIEGAGYRTELVTSGSGKWDEGSTGNWKISVPLDDLPRNVPLRLSIQYADVNGTGAVVEFSYDDRCYPTIVTAPVYEGFYIISGIAEPGSVVSIIYEGETYPASVDVHGVFVARMPLVMEGDEITIRTEDLAGNINIKRVTVGPEQDSYSMKGYMLGKTFTNLAYADEPDWFMASRLTRAELEQGVKINIVAANAFGVGEMELKADENGCVKMTYTMEDGVSVKDTYFCLMEDIDVEAVLDHEEEALSDGFQLPGWDTFWFVAEFQMDVPEELLKDSFQLYKYSESELRLLYRNRQRSVSLIVKEEEEE